MLRLSYIVPGKLKQKKQKYDSIRGRLMIGRFVSISNDLRICTIDPQMAIP